MMATARMTMMTEEDIRTELGWDDDMIDYLLRGPRLSPCPAQQAYWRLIIWAVQARTSAGSR
jgi:hypothetical protein